MGSQYSKPDFCTFTNPHTHANAVRDDNVASHCQSYTDRDTYSDPHAHSIADAHADAHTFAAGCSGHAFYFWCEHCGCHPHGEPGHVGRHPGTHVWLHVAGLHHRSQHVVGRAASRMCVAIDGQNLCHHRCGPRKVPDGCRHRCESQRGCDDLVAEHACSHRSTHADTHADGVTDPHPDPDAPAAGGSGDPINFRPSHGWSHAYGKPGYVGGLA